MHKGKCRLARSSTISALISSPVVGPEYSEATPATNPRDIWLSILVRRVSPSIRIIDRAVDCQDIRKVLEVGKILTDIERIFKVRLKCSQNNAELFLTRNVRPAIF